MIFVSSIAYTQLQGFPLTPIHLRELDELYDRVFTHCKQLQETRAKVLVGKVHCRMSFATIHTYTVESSILDTLGSVLIREMHSFKELTHIE